MRCPYHETGTLLTRRQYVTTYKVFPEGPPDVSWKIDGKVCEHWLDPKLLTLDEEWDDPWYMKTSP